MAAAKRFKTPYRLPNQSEYMQNLGQDDESEEDAVDYSSLKPVPPSAFYDRFEKIRQANLELTRDVLPTKKKPANSKVRFKDDISYDDEDDISDGEDAEGKSTPTKVLLVTVPTVYSQESEEAGSECSDCEEPDTPTSNEGSFREDPEDDVDPGGYVAWETHPEEDEQLEEESSSSRQESSTETVILARSETEDEGAELTEWFSRSINLEEQEPREEEGRGTDLVEEVGHRPRTAISVKVHRKRVGQREAERPATAPVRRQCCHKGIVTKLPSYNGLRSEYGLSQQQLHQREKKKLEIANALKVEKEQRYLEHKKKRKENEITFNNWLIKKKREAEAKAIRRLRQSNYCFRTIPAPTSHLDKIGILRRKMLRKENTCFLLNEIFKNAKPHEQKTYRIYLGLRSQ